MFKVTCTQYKFVLPGILLTCTCSSNIQFFKLTQKNALSTDDPTCIKTYQFLNNWFIINNNLQCNCVYIRFSCYNKNYVIHNIICSKTMSRDSLLLAVSDPWANTPPLLEKINLSLLSNKMFPMLPRDQEKQKIEDKQ